jgi:hypothetical protein
MPDSNVSATNKTAQNFLQHRFRTRHETTLHHQAPNAYMGRFGPCNRHWRSPCRRACLLVVNMNAKMLRHVRQLWNSPLVTREINRANQRKWIRQVRILGDRWLLAKYVERKSHAN